MQAFRFLFFFFVRGHQLGGHAPRRLAETVETGDKNHDDFHFMQMSLVIIMRLIFGDGRMTHVS